MYESIESMETQLEQNFAQLNQKDDKIKNQYKKLKLYEIENI